MNCEFKATGYCVGCPHIDIYPKTYTFYNTNGELCETQTELHCIREKACQRIRKLPKERLESKDESK